MTEVQACVAHDPTTGPNAANPIGTSETKKNAHAEKAVSVEDTHATPAAHAEEATSEGGGFGFFSFVIFVLLLIGTVIFMDKTVLKPEK